MNVDDLDRVSLDLQHLQARHIEGGIEIATSRGCIHKCSFCSILGRESYQARSAGSVFSLLDTYQARFEELFGEHIPSNSYRVHFSDDDFACDKPRAAEVFRRILDTPFRLSSVQVAVGDLCRREGGKLLAEPDPAILDAIRPECFADHGRPIPKVDFYEDHKSRNWSSFLQIGVETYSDREIARLGKGYKRAHIRTIVGELARRGLHMDGYFILSNVDTSAEDLVDVFTEVARLKLRFPEHFHMRFPVVQHLVSYFTAASHRRHIRRGRRHVMKLRGHAQVPNHAELDYPFVDHDEPLDVWVRDTVAHTFVTDAGLYTENLSVLAAMWKPRWKALPEDDPDRRRIGRLLRKLDDRPRRVVFDMLRHAWLGEDEGWPVAELDKEACLDTAERVLGPSSAWMHLLRRVVREDTERRLVVDSALPEHLRDDAIDLLWSSDTEALALHLVGGEGIDDWVRRWEARPSRAERRRPRRLIVDASVGTSEPLPPGVERQWTVPVGRPLTPPSSVPDRAVLVVEPDGVGALAACWRAAVDAGARAVVVAPRGRWSASDAQALAQALFALGPWLRVGGAGVGADDLLPGRQDAPAAHMVAVAADGTITRADVMGRGDDLGRAERLARVDQLTNIDRHVLTLAEPTTLRRAGSLEQVEQGVAPARQVLKKFAQWVARPDEASDAPGARP